MAVNLEQTTEYATLLESIKTRIQSTQIRAALAVNQELILLYHQIGHDIVQAQQNHGWGDKVLERIATDLKAKSLYISTVLVKNPEVMSRSLTGVFPELKYEDILK